jgi:hypothetical protein
MHLAVMPGREPLIQAIALVETLGAADADLGEAEFRGLLTNCVLETFHGRPFAEE